MAPGTPYRYAGGIRQGLALVFDVDGVIVDSNPVHSRCWREYFRGFGLEAPPGFDQRMYGKRNDEIVRGVFGAGLNDAEVARHGAEKEKLYRKTMKPVLEQHLVAGLAEFLDRHQDVPKAVASNCELPNLEFVLRESGFNRHFHLTLHGGLVQRPKPDPEIYLRAAELLGIPPADCIVFEDSRAGVQAARLAGARVVGIATTHMDLEGVSICVRDFKSPELNQWLIEQAPV